MCTSSRTASDEPVRWGARKAARATLALAIALSGAACIEDPTLGVEIGEVGVEPSAVSIMKDDSVHLEVVVRDINGDLVPGAHVIWGAQPRWVASVSPAGLVRGLQAGPATVTATFEGVSGSATVTVLSGTPLSASPGSLTFYAEAGGHSPERQTVKVDDPSGALAGLDIVIEYGDAGAWIDLEFEDGPGPVDVRVTPHIGGMDPGRYTASLWISDAVSRVAPLAVPVDLVLASLEVTETDDNTVLNYMGDRDTVWVSLGARPDLPVVIKVDIGSEKVATVSPTELVFSPDGWSTPRALVLTGGERAYHRRDPAAKLRIEIDDDESDAAYKLVGRVEVDVATGLLYGLPVDSAAAPGGS